MTHFRREITTRVFGHASRLKMSSTARYKRISPPLIKGGLVRGASGLRSFCIKISKNSRSKTGISCYILSSASRAARAKRSGPGTTRRYCGDHALAAQAERELCARWKSPSRSASRPLMAAPCMDAKRLLAGPRAVAR